MKSISPAELKQLTNETGKFLLVDVREPFEHVAFNIGGELIPVNTLLEDPGRIPKDKDVIVYCQKGIRSAIVIQRLELQGFTNLINLSGGMDAYLQLEANSDKPG